MATLTTTIDAVTGVLTSLASTMTSVLSSTTAVGSDTSPSTTPTASPGQVASSTSTLSTLSASLLPLSSSTEGAAAAGGEKSADIVALQESITAFYLIITGAMVWAMQAGFTFLEAGTMRQKNTVNSLTRMFMNGWIAAVMWWLVGYAFAFGTGNGFIGFNPTAKWALGSEPPNDLALWFFEYTFCAASAAIISGSVAEHVTHHGFALYCMFFTGWIYPIAAHWEWSADGWLFAGHRYPTSSDNPRATPEVDSNNDTIYYYTADYQDFAGSGIVHITGAFAGLAAMIILCPREGMKATFKQPAVEKPHPHSLPLTTLGSMLLTFGFIAFNGGSQLALHRPGDSGAMSTAVCNTIISGAGGAMSAILWHKVFGYFPICYRNSDAEGKWSLLVAINGSLCGMVAICAGCNVFYPWGAFVVGVISGLSFALWVAVFTKLRVDDPMDTFAVHGGAGIWGALAVALLKRNGGIVVLITDANGTHGNCTAEGWMYFAWQLLGVVVIAAWAFVNMGLFLIVLRLIDLCLSKADINFRLLRPSSADQKTGMDEVENDEMAYNFGDLRSADNQNGSGVYSKRNYSDSTMANSNV